MEQRRGQQQAFREELARPPVHQQVHQVYAQAYHHHVLDKVAAMPVQATAAAAVNRTLHQTAAVHPVQVRNMFVRSQAAVHHQAATTGQHTTLATTDHRQAATAETTVHQEVHPTQAAAVAQVQVTVAAVAVQAPVLEVAVVAQVPAAAIVVVAAAVAVEEDKDK